MVASPVKTKRTGRKSDALMVRCSKPVWTLAICVFACLLVSACNVRKLNISKEEAPPPMVSKQWKEQTDWLEHQQDGDFFLYIQRYDRAEDSFKTAIKKAEDARFRDARLARSQAGLARAYSNRRKFQDAIRLYDKALEIKRKAYGENHYDVADILTERAFVNVSLFNTDAARQDVERAKQIYRNLKLQPLLELQFVEAAVDVQSGKENSALPKFKSATDQFISQINLHHYPQSTKSMRVARDCGDRYASLLDSRGKRAEAQAYRDKLRPITEWMMILGERGV